MTKSTTDLRAREWPSPVCAQPECGLRRIQFNRTRLAELLVQAVARDGEAKPVSERERIVPERICFDCALRVVRGQRPFLTADERNRITEENEAHRHDSFVVVDGVVDGGVDGVVDGVVDEVVD